MRDDKPAPVVVIKRGVSALHAVGIVLVTLQLAGVINWHWAFVLLPFYLLPLSSLITIAILGYYAWWVYRKVKRNDPE